METFGIASVTVIIVITYLVGHYDVTGPARQMAGKNNAEWKAFKFSVKALLNERPKSVPAPTTKEVYQCISTQ